MVKAQCLESFEVHSFRIESRRQNHKPTVNSAVPPSEVGKGVLRGNSEGTSSDAASPHQLYSCPYTQPALANMTKQNKTGYTFTDDNAVSIINMCPVKERKMKQVKRTGS